MPYTEGYGGMTKLLLMIMIPATNSVALNVTEAKIGAPVRAVRPDHSHPPRSVSEESQILAKDADKSRLAFQMRRDSDGPPIATQKFAHRRAASDAGEDFIFSFAGFVHRQPRIQFHHEEPSAAEPQPSDREFAPRRARRSRRQEEEKLLRTIRTSCPSCLRGEITPEKSGRAAKFSARVAIVVRNHEEIISRSRAPPPLSSPAERGETFYEGSQVGSFFHDNVSCDFPPVSFP